MTALEYPDAPLHATEILTPFGPFSAFVTPEDGVVRASGLGTLLSIAKALPSDLVARGWEESDVPEVSGAIRDWLAGDGAALARIPVAQIGGAFMQRVWLAMRGIPSGEVVTYGELAVLAGNPRAARAVGHACASNRLGLFVPCHRVVSATGIGQYGPGGNEVKRQATGIRGSGHPLAESHPAGRS